MIWRDWWPLIQMMGTADEKSGDGRPEPDGFTSQVFANYEVAQEGSVHGGKKKGCARIYQLSHGPTG